MGERMEFSLQAKSTAAGVSAMLASDMQHAEQGEEPARRQFVEFNPVGEAFAKKRCAFIVQGAPAHVDRLDAGGTGSLDGLKVALADHEVILHDPPERLQSEGYALEELFAGFIAHLQDQALNPLHPQGQA